MLLALAGIAAIFCRCRDELQALGVIRYSGAESKLLIGKQSNGQHANATRPFERGMIRSLSKLRPATERVQVQALGATQLERPPACCHYTRARI